MKAQILAESMDLMSRAKEWKYTKNTPMNWLRRALHIIVFCEKNEDAEDSENVTGYNRKCRNLTKVQIDNNLKAGLSYVIRQKIPFEGSTTFHDEVYGDITVENATLDDQILLKKRWYAYL